MTPTESAVLGTVLARHAEALAAATSAPAAEAPGRRPVHVVYGGAHLFTHDVAARLGQRALQALEAWAPDFVTLARALRMPGAERLPVVPAERQRLAARLAADPAQVRRAEPQAYLAWAIHERTRARLEREPVDDYRADFEDGFGVRPDAEEDDAADTVGRELARGLVAGTLPAACGIRIKPLTPAWAERAARTLERCLAALAAGAPGRVPEGFVVTLPKVTHAAQVTALADACDALEARFGLPAGAIGIELMIETPESVLAPDGRVPLRVFVAAARGRCRGAHFGAYDYTAACGVVAAHQSLAHPACVLARQLMLAALAGTGVRLADGAVTRLPVAPHRPAEGAALLPAQVDANRAAVHEGWRLHHDEVRRALREGFDLGWDLHPAQLVSRHAAVIGHYLEARDEAAARLEAFVAQAARAARCGRDMDDAATGRGLLQFFARGLACGALTAAEAEVAGLAPEHLAPGGLEKWVAARVAR